MNIARTITVLLLIINFSAISQITTITPGFYSTVNDYESKNIKNVGAFGANDVNKVIFENDGKKVVYPCRDMTE